MNSLQNLQLNIEQATLSKSQQIQLLGVISRLLRSNFDPKTGSILVVRQWANGKIEEILSGNLERGIAMDCHTQRYEHHNRKAAELVNELHCNSDELVRHEVDEALRCESPDSYYYCKMRADTGSVYVGYGHYVLSLPIENGRIVAAFRAVYCWRGSRVSSAASEPWQHELILVSLAEALSRIMSDDTRIHESLDELARNRRRRNAKWHSEGSSLVQRILSDECKKVYFVVNLGNSKMIRTSRPAVATYA